ncbi:hypothetical protein VTI28DRAFT_6145 [Corynascus sepedonium]
MAARAMSRRNHQDIIRKYLTVIWGSVSGRGSMKPKTPAHYTGEVARATWHCLSDSWNSGCRRGSRPATKFGSSSSHLAGHVQVKLSPVPGYQELELLPISARRSIFAAPDQSLHPDQPLPRPGAVRVTHRQKPSSFQNGAIMVLILKSIAHTATRRVEHPKPLQPPTRR